VRKYRRLGFFLKPFFLGKKIPKGRVLAPTPSSPEYVLA